MPKVETKEMRERLALSSCPFCGHDNVSWESPDCEGDTAWQCFHCPKCDRSGAEIYERAGFEDHTNGMEMYRTPSKGRVES